MARGKEDKDIFLGIGASITALMIPIVLFVVLFAKEQSWVLAPIASAMAIMGIGLGYFTFKSKKKKKR